MAADLNPEHCYRAVASRDRRFDGMFVTAVSTTGIYCRPSCPARTPGRDRVTFHHTAAAAQAAGFRACKRCLPDASPGSPRWDVAADLTGRAIRLICDGVVERESVSGLAARLGYSPRQLQRHLVEHLGAGPLALARAHRAQNARILIETTSWKLSDIAYAAGFTSVRQFNDTIKEVYSMTPSQLRPRLGRTDPAQDSAGIARVPLRLAVRTPYHQGFMHRFLAAHVVDGVEAAGGSWYARSLRLPLAPAVVKIAFDDTQNNACGTTFISCTLHLGDVGDLPAARERLRRMLDADADPVAIDSALNSDPVLASRVTARPGVRVPGAVDGNELALRTVLGQQISLSAANLLATKISSHGDELPPALQLYGLRFLFPTAAQVAGLDPRSLPMPRARALSLVTLAGALVRGDLALDRSGEREVVRAALLDMKGIGPWTADYISMRALADPDVFLRGDVVARRVVDSWGAAGRTDDWSPWRSYALMHVWAEAIDNHLQRQGRQ